MEEVFMTNEERDIQRKLKVLQHAEKIGNARKACRYFGVGRSSFYRWRDAYQKHGEAGLKNAKSIPKNPANQTPAEIVEKVLYLRRKYHLGPIRIVWYLARYHGIKISDAGVYRILKRNGLNRLPRGTRMRKLHTNLRGSTPRRKPPTPCLSTGHHDTPIGGCPRLSVLMGRGQGSVVSARGAVGSEG